MITDPICIVSEPIPEGWFLVEGNHITNTARSARIPFRVARRPAEKKGHHPIPVGIIIQVSDREKWNETTAKALARREREAKYPSYPNKH